MYNIKYGEKMNNNLTTINQNSKLALNKAKNLINITNKILLNTNNKDLSLLNENLKLYIESGHTHYVNSVAIS